MLPISLLENGGVSGHWENGIWTTLMVASGLPLITCSLKVTCNTVFRGPSLKVVVLILSTFLSYWIRT